MKTGPLLAILFLSYSCSVSRVATHSDKKKTVKEHRSITRDQVLRGYVKKTIPREGKYSTVTDGFVTKETYQRDDGESIFILEKGELRVETEARKSGLVLTRTWQDGVLTSMTVAGLKRTTLIYFDREGEFLNKIVTIRDTDTPMCYHYKNGVASVMDDGSCLSLIPEFD